MATPRQGIDRPPFPFVVGSGRSGTTLLRAMLDSHPEVAVPPETYFITELLDREPAYRSPGGFDVEAFASDLLANQWFRRWGLPAERARAELLEAAPTSFADAIRSVFAQYARSCGKRRYADKTPVYVYEIATLAELFDEACFVHLIRDGRDVASSFVDRDDMRPHGVAEAALLWRERVGTGRGAGRELAPGRYLELRYEELVAAPEAALARVCEFCGLDYDARMLDYVDRAHELAAVDGGPSRHRGLFEPPTPGLRDWRARLRPAEVEAFELIAGDLLEELGYERATDAELDGAGASVRLLVEEIEGLRLELVASESEHRRRVREGRERARKARRRARRLKSRLEQLESAEA